MKCRSWAAALVFVCAAACLQSCNAVKPDARLPEPSAARPDETPQQGTGIDGEPVPLNSADPKYSAYFEQIRSLIKSKWGFPCVKVGVECEYKNTDLDIEFGIAKDGQLVFVKLLRASPWSIYNDYALYAIRRAVPFPPVPDALLQGNGLPIRARFNYVVERSVGGPKGK